MSIEVQWLKLIELFTSWENVSDNDRKKLSHQTNTDPNRVKLPLDKECFCDHPTVTRKLSYPHSCVKNRGIKINYLYSKLNVLITLFIQNYEGNILHREHTTTIITSNIVRGLLTTLTI